MPEGDGSHAETPRRPAARLLHRTTTGLVVLVLLLAGAAYQFDLGPRWFGFDYPSPVTEPAEVAPPPGLSLPAAEQADAVAEPLEPAEADPKAVRRAVAKLVRKKELGRDVTVVVTQLSDGEVVYERGEKRVIPASTMKTLTAAAALETLGGEHRFRTTVVTGPGRGAITLVGGGDPLLARRPYPAGDVYPPRSDLQTLARATAAAVRDLGRSKIRLRYDDTLFTGPPVNPQWEPSYVPDNVVSPISALWVDEGREANGSYLRSDDPARAAAAAFAAALEQRRVKVVGPPVRRAADADATELAAVESAPLDQVVEHVLEVSDNEGAEVLARHVALAAGEPASFQGASRAVKGTLDGLGVDTSGAVIQDGSGLSRGNRLSPTTLLDLVETAASPEHPGLRPVLAGLPVAGFTGSLTYRFDSGDRAGLGVVRAKTGTLSRVHALAGTVTTVDGALLGFVAVADRVRIPDTLEARATLDELAAELAGCACAA